jgi:hypothetical protein
MDKTKWAPEVYPFPHFMPGNADHPASPPPIAPTEQPCGTPVSYRQQSKEDARSTNNDLRHGNNKEYLGMNQAGKTTNRAKTPHAS